MSKVTLNNLSNLQNENTAVTTINNNNDAIEAGFDNTLSRDGSSPNQMNASIDMNSYRVLNLSNPISPTEPLRLQDLVDFNSIGYINQIPTGGTVGQSLIKNSSLNFDAGWHDTTADHANYTPPVISGATRTVTTRLADRYDVRDWGVKADGVTDDTAALQAALDFCPLNATLYGPKGSMILVSAAGAQCLLMTRALNLEDIWIGTANTLGSTIDMLTVQPTTGDWQNVRFTGLKLGSQSGRYGRHGLRFNHTGATQTIINGLFTGLEFLQGDATVGNAIYQDNAAGLDAQGGLQNCVFRDCLICNGAKLVKTGDRVGFDNCTFLGSATGGAFVDVDFISGAMNFHFTNNNVGETSLFIRSGLYTLIWGNTFEQTRNAYQPNSAVIDFDSTVSSVQGAIVENNIFRMLNAVSPSNLIRFNNAFNCKVKAGNHLHMATTTSPIIINNNCTNIHVSRQMEVDSLGASWVGSTQYVGSHDKPVVNRFVGNADTTISVDGNPPDHTLSTTTALTADRTWTLPALSHCFPGEEFYIQDLANAIGTFKIILARSGSDIFQGGGTTYNMLSPGGRVLLKAQPSLGVWTVTGATKNIDTDSTMGSGSNAALPTQGAVKTALALKLDKTAQHQIFSGNSGAQALAAGETRYIVTANFLTAESQVYIPVPIAGTFSNLSITTVGAPGAGQTYTATVRKTLAATAITCQISGAASNSAADNTNTVHFNAGDRLAVQFVASAGAASNACAFGLIFTPD